MRKYHLQNYQPKYLSNCRGGLLFCFALGFFVCFVCCFGVFFSIYYNQIIIPIVSSWQKHSDNTQTQKKTQPNTPTFFPLHTFCELHSFSGYFIPVLLHSSPGIFPLLKSLTQNTYHVQFLFFFWMKCFSNILSFVYLESFATCYYRILPLEQSQGVRMTGSPRKTAQAVTFVLLSHRYDMRKVYYIFNSLKCCY